MLGRSRALGHGGGEGTLLVSSKLHIPMGSRRWCFEDFLLHTGKELRNVVSPSRASMEQLLETPLGPADITHSAGCAGVQ